MATSTIRKDQLVRATIAEIGTHGAENVTVARIARRAGVSSALAFHYFGDKEQLFLGAMRHILRVYSQEVRDRLAEASGHEARLRAILSASFAPSNFDPQVVSAWLHFYVTAQTSGEAARLLAVYQRRLRSNLLHDLRPLLGAGARDAADGLGALIDGLYIRQGLPGSRRDLADAEGLVLDDLARRIGGRQ